MPGTVRPRSRDLDQVVRAYYSRGVGKVRRVRGLPHNQGRSTQSELVARKFWNGIRPRRVFAFSTATITDSTPVGAIPTTTTEKKNHARKISAAEELPQK